MPLGVGKMLGSEEARAGVATKFEQAMADLAAKGERQRAEKARKEAQARRVEEVDLMDKERQMRVAGQADAEAMFGSEAAREVQDEMDDYDALLEEDKELDMLREKRKAQLRKQRKTYEENLAKGHGEYTEIVQDEFLNAVLKSKFCIVHFYHNDFERCKLMDKHLKILAAKHVETKFLKIDAGKTPFFVDKLGIRTLPTCVFFCDGADVDRLVGFQDLSGDEFRTRELEERLGISGVIKMEKAFYEVDRDEPAGGSSSSIPKRIFSSSRVRDQDDDPFAD